MATQRQIEANRRNAAKSTGPKSAEGKARARLNAMTHGLRSREVVLPTEDPAEFDAHLGAWLADWQPPTMARRHLVERLASASWRLKRCVRIETRRLSDRVEEALARGLKRREAELDQIVARLGQGPLEVVEELEATRDGIERFRDEWRKVLDAATEPGGWSDPYLHNVRYFNLLGYFTSDPEVVDDLEGFWGLLLVARPDLARDEHDLPLPADEAEALRESIRMTAREQIERLDALAGSAVDVVDAIARRAEADAFDPRPCDAALLRYEGQLDRSFRADLGQLIKLSQAGADLIDDVGAPSGPNFEAELVAPSDDSVESDGPPDGPGDEPESPTEAVPAEAEAGAPSEPNAEVPVVPILPPVGGLDGSSWPVVELPGAGVTPLIA